MTATITQTIVTGYENGDRHYGAGLVTLFEGIGDDETTASASIGGFADKSVQVVGTIGAGTVAIQGSNDGATWFQLTDGIGNDLSFSAVGGKAIWENTRYIRVVTASGSSNDVDVYIFGARTS